MIPFKRIVFPADYSAACEDAVPYVVEAATRHSASLVVLHAYQASTVYASELGLATPGMPLPAEIQQTEETRLAEFSARAFPGLKPVLRLVNDDPGRAIVEAVHRDGADLVMMPTRGLGVFRRLLLGSVTAKVLHDVSCAVWTGVHSPGADGKPQVPYRTILCAVNADDEAASVMKAASLLAAEYGAQLSIVHVVELPAGSWDIDISPYRNAVQSAARNRIMSTRAELGIEAPVLILDGPPPESIRNIALDRQADLVVVGRGHAQDAVGRIWSQLYSVVRDSPCPIISV
jgi:nucleotide-binding universal stress UspA family protein